MVGAYKYVADVEYHFVGDAEKFERNVHVKKQGAVSLFS
jgi:hypothetical protein